MCQGKPLFREPPVCKTEANLINLTIIHTHIYIYIYYICMISVDMYSI